jgi:hypothetical protein
LWLNDSGRILEHLKFGFFLFFVFFIFAIGSLFFGFDGCTFFVLFKGDTIYLFTDGAPDQFGGPKGKKLTTKGFRQLLFDIQSQTMEQQGKAINGFYRNWMGNANEQVDDILIMGIRI